MNSLEQLNTFSSATVDYDDEADFSISLLNLGNQSVSGTEGQDHQLPLGITIVDMISGTSTIFYQVDLSTAPSGVTVQWATLPDGVTESTPSSRVSRLTGVSTMAIWDQVKQPNIIVPRDTAGTFSYTVTFNAGVGNVVSWTVSVTLSAQSELNTLTPNSVTYNEDETLTFGSGNVIQITDSENPSSDTYTLVGTFSSSAGTLTSSYSMTGVTSTAGSLTLVNTRSNINSYLQGLQFVPTMDYDQSFSITWVLTNPVSALTTTATQSVNIGTTNDEILYMNLTRSYTENSVNLLFPSSVPQIPETISGATYTVSFELSSSIGIIGLGEDFTTPVGWNSVTKTYTYTGTKAQVNTLLQTVKFFPYSNISSNATVTFRQRRDGTLQVTQTFSLNGTPNTSRITGTSSFTVNEDSTYNISPTAVYPNWDAGAYSLLLQTQRSGSAQTDIATFNLPDGYTYIGNASVASGVYKNYSAAGNLTVYNNYLSEVANVTASLRADYTTSYTQVRALNLGGTYDGTSFSGGTTYYANANVTISGHNEYSIPASITYVEDITKTFSDFAITDLANNKNYSVTLSLNNAAVGNLYYGNVNQGSSVTLTGNKTTLNTNMNTVQFLSTPNGYANTTLLYSQTQTTDNISQASNVSIPLNSTGDLYDPQFSGGYYLLDNSGNYTGSSVVTECYWNVFPYYEITAVGTSGTGNNISNLTVSLERSDNLNNQIYSATPEILSPPSNSLKTRYENYYKRTSWTQSVDPIRYCVYSITANAVATNGQTNTSTKQLTIWADNITFSGQSEFWNNANAPTSGNYGYLDILNDPKRGSVPAANNATYITALASSNSSGIYSVTDSTNIYQELTNAVGYGYDSKDVDAYIVISDDALIGNNSVPGSVTPLPTNAFSYSLATGSVTGNVSMFNAVSGTITLNGHQVFSKSAGNTSTNNSTVATGSFVSTFLTSSKTYTSGNLPFVTNVSIPSTYVNTTSYYATRPITVRLLLRWKYYTIPSGFSTGPAPITPVYSDWTTETFTTYWSK